MILFENVVHSENSNIELDIDVSLIDLTHSHDQAFSLTRKCSAM